MSKVIIYGLEFDTEKDGQVTRLAGNIAVATARAFVKVRKVDRYHNKGYLDVVINEVLRKRIDEEDSTEIEKMFETVKDISIRGMSCKDIVILRSLYFSFEEIKEFARERKTADSVIKEYEIEDPEIEAVYGLTAPTLTEWYVDYKTARRV